jgi:cytochrome c biogenesis protein CcdA
VDIPAIFIGRSVLGGESEIKKNLPLELAQFRKNPEQYLEKMITPFTSVHDTATIKEEQLNKYSSGRILAAGLSDSAALCSTTAVIFLISGLLLVAGNRKQTWFIGGAFVISVFITWLVIGFAFFDIARIVLRDPTLATIVNIIILIFVGALAIFSINHAAKGFKSNSSDTLIGLPKSGSIDLREKISNFAADKIAVLAVAAIIGIIIAATELACTGQVYLPIVTMISEPRTRILATTYLFVYNIAFMAPLVFVLLLAGTVFTSKQVMHFCVKNLALARIIVALLFVAMAMTIIFNLRWL